MTTSPLKIRNKIGWIAGVLLLLSCCMDPHTVYHQHQMVEGGTWGYEDTLSFQLDSLTPRRHYQLTLEGRLNKTYRYQMLIVTLSLDSQVQTLAIPVYEKEGDANSWSGEIPFYIPFQTEIAYTPKDTTGVIQVAHSMGNRTLEGVCDIGLHVKR